MKHPNAFAWGLSAILIATGSLVASPGKISTPIESKKVEIPPILNYWEASAWDTKSSSAATDSFWHATKEEKPKAKSAGKKKDVKLAAKKVRQ